MNAAPLFPDREDMSDDEKQLFLSDLKAVCREYFEADGAYSAEVTKTPNGFSVCVVFDARRIKSFKKPL